MSINHADLPVIRDAPLPVRYEAAKVAIREADQIDECKEWSDRAAALASYAKQADDKELLNIAMRIKARAIRRAGQMLEEMEKAKNQHDAASRDAPTRKEAATQAGFSKDQAVSAIRVARVDEDEFEEQVESESPPTITGLAQQGTRRRVPTRMPWEELGISEPAFRARVHFAFDLKHFVDATREHSVSAVMEGCDDRDKEQMRRHAPEVLQYLNQLQKELNDECQ